MCVLGGLSTRRPICYSHHRFACTACTVCLPPVMSNSQHSPKCGAMHYTAVHSVTGRPTPVQQ